VSSVPYDPIFAALTPTLLTVGLYLIGVAIWPRPTAKSRVLMLSVTLAFMAQYSGWRIAETLPPPAFNLEYAFAIGFLVGETAGAFATALSILFLLRSRDRSADADANADWLAS
jgi:cellulose synthase (UDP-forming)